MEPASFFRKRGQRVQEIPLAEISPNPSQPRRYFDPEALAALADSIKENGLLSPVLLRKTKGGYEIIAGERRVQAFRLLGETKIPALIEQADAERMAVLALVENLQRAELHFFEEAHAIAKLMNTLGLTQQEMAQRLGISQSAVANKLRLQKLPLPIMGKIIEGNLTERHARALLPLCDSPELLEHLCQRVIERHLNVTQTEEWVERVRQTKKKQTKRVIVLKDLRIFGATIERAVSLMREAGIPAESATEETEETITYHIVIAKKKDDPALSIPAVR